MNGLAEIRRANAARPTFQKRHYDVIAAAIAATAVLPHDSPAECLTDLIEALCDRFAADNPEFRRDQFHTASVGHMNGVRP